MTPLSAVRVTDLFALSSTRDRSETLTWIALADGLEGAVSSSLPRGPIGWDPAARAEGMHPLSLYEQEEYLCRIPPGARWAPRCEPLFSPVSCSLGAAGLWLLDVRGRVGTTVFQAFLGDRTLFTLPAELRATKLDHLDDWRAMLDDLARLRVDLCLSQRESPAEVPVDLTGSQGAPQSAWERFVLLRFLSRSGALEDALSAVERAPVTSLGASRRTVPIAQATRARPEDLAASSSPPGPSGLPRSVSETRPEPSLDAPENRFVVTLLDRLIADARAVARDPHAPALGPASAALAERFESLRHTSRLRHVGPLSASAPIHTAALQRRAGYRELLAVWNALADSRPSLLWRAEASGSEPARDTPSLYERWCVLSVCRLLGVPEGRTARILEGAASVRVEVLGRSVEVSSQRTFAEFSGSYSLPLRPDLTLTCGGRRLLLDAKYQLQAPVETALGSPRERAPWASSGVVKMHAYRDAIEGAWGAAVLYPGTESEARWFDAPDRGGVGAFALRPGADKNLFTDQQTAIKTMIERFVTDCDKSTA